MSPAGESPEVTDSSPCLCFLLGTLKRKTRGAQEQEGFSVGCGRLSGCEQEERNTRESGKGALWTKTQIQIFAPR